MVCRLHKSIYGLKQSGACWENRLVEKLKEMNFERCHQDPCLYIKRETSNAMSLIGVYVDALVIACSDRKLREIFIENLKQDFEIKDNGDLTWILGTGVKTNIEAGWTSLNSSLYIADCVREHLGEYYQTDKGPSTPCNDSVMDLGNNVSMRSVGRASHF